MSIYNKYLPLFSQWTAYTPVIPKFYYNVYSLEEAFKYLCKEYDRITHYLDSVIDSINGNDEELQEQIDALTVQVNSIQTAIDDLTDAISGIVTTLPVYDVTQGKFVDSQTANRNMYRELAVFGARVNQVANITVDELATHRVDEVSAVGNLTIFGDSTPRVTDPDTGEPYN